jgi:hypothetical protein
MAMVGHEKTELHFEDSGLDTYAFAEVQVRCE